MKETIYNALIKKNEAIVEENRATLEIYFNNAVGIGEHPQMIEEMNNCLEKMATALGNIETLKNNFS